MFLSALLLAATITTKADVPRMNAAELRAAMQKGEAIAIDVRGTVPWELEHIADAKWLPLGVMRDRVSELPQDKILVTYCTCKAEETSLEAAMLLASMGFEHVAVLHGGFPAWKQAGLPVKSNRTPESEEPTPAPAPVASAGRIAPPDTVECDRNKLTLFAGSVVKYERTEGKTSLTIHTSAETIEHFTLEHPGTDDPSRFFLIDAKPFTKADWKRIEGKKKDLLPKMSAIAWVCEGRTPIIDWRPGIQFTGAE